MATYKTRHGQPGLYNASLPTLPDGAGGALAVDSNGRLIITGASGATALPVIEQYIPVYEDNTNGKAVVEQRYTLSNVTADTLVKTGAGFLHTVTFAQTDAAPTAGSIILYDNTAESGTIIQTVNFTTAVFQPYTLTYNGTFANGLYVGFTTTADVNVTISYR